VLTIVVPPYAQKRVKLRKKEVDYSCYFLVLNQRDTQEAAISCKSCRFSCISSDYLRYFYTYLLLGY